MPIHELTDLNDPALDLFARLTDTQLRRRQEAATGGFVAESPKVIHLALDAGCTPLALLMERRQLEGPGAGVVARCEGVPVYTGPRELLAALTGYTLTRGVLCAMARPAPRTAADVAQNARRLAVLENIVDATNVGAIFRSAAALGIDGVLLSPACCDPLCRRALRVSMGHVLRLPWARLGQDVHAWPAAGLAELRALGFATAALALRDDARPIGDAAIAALPKLALLLGTEGDGLLPETIAACDYTLRIPMRPGVDSLNVGAAAAVAFWVLGGR